MYKYYFDNPQNHAKSFNSTSVEYQTVGHRKG